MSRPEVLSAQRKLKSDELVVQPYTRAIVLVVCIAVLVTVTVFVLASDAIVVGVALAAIVVLAANVIGYILLLAKQVEFVHRVNSRMDELLNASGLNEYIAGQKQGRADLMQEIEDGENDTT